MSKKKKFSSRVVESVDPMSAFIDDSEELAVPSEEQPIEEEAKPQETLVEEPPKETEVKEAKSEKTKADVLDMLHGEKMLEKTNVLEKNSLPIQLLNNQAEKKVVMIDSPSVGKLYDLLEVARQHAVGYQGTWDASIRAYARHVGFPNMASLDECKGFLAKWGAKLKD